MISAPECIDLCATSSDDDSILVDNEKPVTSLVIKKETGYREETLLKTLQTAGGEGSGYTKGNNYDIDLNNDDDDFNSNPSMERMSGNFSADPVNSSDNAETIISILVVSPQDMELKSKPSGIRKNNVFTLNNKTVSIKSAKSDDNGVYIIKETQRGFTFTPKKLVVTLFITMFLMTVISITSGMAIIIGKHLFRRRTFTSLQEIIERAKIILISVK